MPLLDPTEQAEYEGIGLATPHALVNKLMIGFAIVLTVPLYASLSRAAATGWLPLYGVHIALYALILLSALFRNHLQARLKAAILIFCCYAVAIAGHYSFGLLAGGVFYLPIAVALLVFFFSIRTVILFGALTVAVIGAIGYSYVTGILTTATDISTLQRALPQWLNYLLSLLVFFVMTVIIMRSYRDILRGMIDRISGQKDEIVKLTHFDQLTGVATLPLALDHIGEALRRADAEATQGALLLLSIGDIDQINDDYGYEYGELMIRTVSERLTLLLRPEDKLARIGGSTYLIVIDRMKDSNRALFLAEMITDSFKKPVRSGTRDLILTCSIGITLFPNARANTPQQLIKQANDARLQAEREQLPVSVFA